MTPYAQTRRTEGKPLLLILRELHVNRTFGKLLFQLWKWKQSCFSDQRYPSNLFVFPFHFIDRKSRPFFAQSAGDQNAWSKCFWRSEWWEKLRDPGDTLKKRLKKTKTRRGGGGGRWGSNQHWAVLHGNLFGFPFRCDTVTNGLQLEERCLQNQGETLQSWELFIFRWFCESILVKWHHINLYIINISHSLNISVTHRSCGSFICLICRNQDY